tara:strand:+ start:69 stop:485 length:417 start_codon:yes stop_codon:yes gene_type:complete
MKKILIILLLSFSFSAELDMNQDDCSNLGIDNAKEQSYEQIFNSGLIMGFVTAGVFGLPAYAYRNKYLEKYKTHEINFQNIDVEDYENDDLCKQEYIESYNRTVYEIRKTTYTKGVFTGTVAVFGTVLLMGLLPSIGN